METNLFKGDDILKKLISIVLSLSVIFVFSFIMGCGKNSESYESFINKLIAPETYEETKKVSPSEVGEGTSKDGQVFELPLDENVKKLFEDCLDENGMKDVRAYSILDMYEDVIKSKNITSVKNVKISDVKKSDKKMNDSEFNYLTCKVNYVYVTSNNENIDMEEIFSFYINKDNKLIHSIKFNPSNSVIKLYQEFLKTKK